MSSKNLYCFPHGSRQLRTDYVGDHTQRLLLQIDSSDGLGVVTRDILAPQLQGNRQVCKTNTFGKPWHDAAFGGWWMLLVCGIATFVPRATRPLGIVPICVVLTPVCIVGSSFLIRSPCLPLCLLLLGALGTCFPTSACCVGMWSFPFGATFSFSCSVSFSFLCFS